MVGLWLCWVFLAACGLTLVEVNGGYALVVGLRLFIEVASLAMACRNALSAQASVAVARGLNSCGSLALELGKILHLSPPRRFPLF